MRMCAHAGACACLRSALSGLTRRTLSWECPSAAADRRRQGACLSWPPADFVACLPQVPGSCRSCHSWQSVRTTSTAEPPRSACPGCRHELSSIPATSPGILSTAVRPEPGSLPQRVLSLLLQGLRCCVHPHQPLTRTPPLRQVSGQHEFEQPLWCPSCKVRRSAALAGSATAQAHQRRPLASRGWRQHCARVWAVQKTRAAGAPVGGGERAGSEYPGMQAYLRQHQQRAATRMQEDSAERSKGHASSLTPSQVGLPPRCRLFPSRPVLVGMEAGALASASSSLVPLAL